MCGAREKIAIKKIRNLNRDRIFMVEQFIRTLHHIPPKKKVFVCTFRSLSLFHAFLFHLSLTRACTEMREREPVIMLSVVARTFLWNERGMDDWEGMFEDCVGK